MRRSLRRKEAPWASSESRSISPNRIPPPILRPLIGCLVRLWTGPVARTWEEHDINIRSRILR